MKRQYLYSALAAAALFGSASALSLAEQNAQSGHFIVAMKDCDVVAKVNMTPDLIAAHERLESAEADMERVHQPIKAIEPEIQRISAQIQDVVKKAVVRSEGVTIINEALMSEQEVLADELEAIMDTHQMEFDQLEQKADEISAAATDFEAQLRELLGDVEYDQINVRTPKSKESAYYCYDDASLM